MGGSAGMSVGTPVDLFGLSHLGNCASSNKVCTVVKRTLFGECMDEKLTSLPGATPKYTISSDLWASLSAHTLDGRKMYAVQPKTHKWLT